jgi:tRNA pseudouridine32 synthase/23S rRNA pseudouridine746 synthase
MLKMFHRYNTDISKIALPERFTYPFCYEPHLLVCLAAEEVRKHLENTELGNILSEGKMLGVLVVRRGEEVGFLAGCSGVVEEVRKDNYFVPMVFDILEEGGYFKTEETNISAINTEISNLQTSEEYTRLQNSLKAEETKATNEIHSFKASMAERKKKRDAQRISGVVTTEMIRESQFDKAELKRIKAKAEEKLDEYRETLSKYEEKIASLCEERRRRSVNLQKWLFSQYVFLNARGEKSNAYDIFQKERGELPPGGTGDCAAPKMLQYAYKNNLEPLAFGEFWWGNSPKSEIRNHLSFYPSCKGKCEPLLKFMLQGIDVEQNPLSASRKFSDLKIVYEDDYILAVDKPSGMLSVRGKDAVGSVEEIIRLRFPETESPLIIHRLDMDTSGLLLIAKTKAAHKAMQKLFEECAVEKTYLALVEGKPVDDYGEVCLPLIADYYHRPLQKVDYDNGKHSVTRYEVVKRFEEKSLVLFHPLTGRTHQIRVHAAHKDGLGMPVCGDRLYGKSGERLCLHALSVRFVHPMTGEEMKIETEMPDFISAIK